jgi:hypothetical protein
MNQVSFSNMDEIGKQNQSIDSFKEGGEIKHISGKVGGYLVGKRHSEGGIKAINKSTGQPLEMEGGEVVITRNAVSSGEKHEFEGQMLTNREILSKINESGGGVSFEDGGEVCHVCDAEYNYKGKKMKDIDIFKEMAKGGEIDDILQAVDDLTFEDLNEKFSDEKDAVIEALMRINEGGVPWRYCFKGKKNTPYQDKFYVITNGADSDVVTFYEVFINDVGVDVDIIRDDIVNNFTVLPEEFEIYVNNFEHIVYKQIGKFQSFTLGSPTGLKAVFKNLDGQINVDAFECVVVTDENKELLSTNNPEVSPQTTNQEILDYVEYWKTLMPSTFTSFDKFDNTFVRSKFFRAYAVIHRESISSPIELKYFILYGKMVGRGTSASEQIYSFNLRDDQKRIWKVEANIPFDHFNKKGIDFSNIYNLDIIIGYKDCYDNLDLNYLCNFKMPIKINNSEFSEGQSRIVSITTTGDDELAFNFSNRGSINTVTIESLEDSEIKNISIDFNESNTQKERKYIESRIRELGLKIKLFRASMTLEEFGAVQRKLREYVKVLQESYLKEQNSNPISFFERIKDAIKLDFGNINAQYPPTTNLSINGLPSQLTEQEWLTVRREDFKIWFGDWEQAYYDQNYSGVSTIIDDATKEPLAVYHGTNVKFVDWKTYESNTLHYFAKKREMSEWFARAWEMGRDDKAGKESQKIKEGNPFQGAFLYRVFLYIKNPIDFSPFGVEKVKLADLIAYLKIKYGVGDFELWSKNDYFKKGTVTMESKIFTWQIIRLWQNFNTYVREFTPYDGFIFYEYIPSKANSGNIEDASLSYCAFRTEQIKFHDAVSFSTEVADSRFKRGGVVKNTTKTRKRK